MSTPDRRAISALPLLVTWVVADHHHAPMATDDLALLTHGLHARSYLHRFSFLSNSVPLTLVTWCCCPVPTWCTASFLAPAAAPPLSGQAPPGAASPSSGTATSIDEGR